MAYVPKYVDIYFHHELYNEVTSIPEAIICSGLKVPAAPAEGFRTHIGGHEVVLHHTS